MGLGFGLGPVFAVEKRIRARRRQVYAGRAGFVLLLLAGMATIWWANLDNRADGLRAQANLGAAYFYAMVGVQLALTMIVAPAATAGAICVERARGSLAHMLVTDLTRGEIVAGKLAARLLPTVLLIACAWPVASLGSLLGGINPHDLTMAFAITLAVGLAGCSLALGLSAWVRSTHEVLMVVYAFWAAVLLAYPLSLALTFSLGWPGSQAWTLTADPFWLAFAPYVDPARVNAADYGWFFGAAFALALGGFVLAWVGVRLNPLGLDRPRPRRRWWNRAVGVRGPLGRWIRRVPGPSLDGNPVLWREWHRVRVSRPVAVLMFALIAAGTGLCLQGAYEIMTQGFSPRVGFAGIMTALAQVVFGMLMVAVLASLTFSDERRRGSLDVLLATPLSTRSIVWAKWLGAYRVVPLLAIGPALVLAEFSQMNFDRLLAQQPSGARWYYSGAEPWLRAYGATLMPLTILAHGAWLTSLGLACSIWIRREGRAIAAVAAAYVIEAMGVPFLVIYLNSPSGPLGPESWALGSGPVLATIQLVEALERLRGSGRIGPLVWIGIWDAVAFAVAWALFEAAVRSFDRAFDRVPESAWPPPFRRGGGG